MNTQKIFNKFPPMWGDYFYITRTTAFGLTAMAPLLILYEVLAITLGRADMLDTQISVLFLDKIVGYSGVHGPFITGILLLSGIFISLFIKEKKIVKFRFSFFAVLILESVIHALLWGYIIELITNRVFLSATSLDKQSQLMLMLAFGAGFYEELLFRAFLFNVSAITLIKFKFNPLFAYIFTALGSSLAFSLFHYINNEPIYLETAFFRFLLGVFFCILYKFRGIGVCAWTHTLYDLFLYLPKWSLF